MDWDWGLFFTAAGALGSWIIPIALHLQSKSRPHAKPATKRNMVPRKWLYSLAVFSSISFLASAWDVYSSPPKFRRIPLDHLVTVNNQQFANEEIVLDGKDFENCTFTYVTLRMQGKHNFSLQHNTFNGPIKISYDQTSSALSSALILSILNEAKMMQPEASILIGKDGNLVIAKGTTPRSPNTTEAPK